MIEKDIYRRFYFVLFFGDAGDGTQGLSHSGKHSATGKNCPCWSQDLSIFFSLF